MKWKEFYRKRKTGFKHKQLDFLIRSDEGLTLETSALESLYSGHFTFINSVDKTTLVSTPQRRSTTVSLETNPLKPIFIV